MARKRKIIYKVLIFVCIVILQGCNQLLRDTECFGKDQNLTIQGYIVDASDSTPIPDAKLHITLYNIGPKQILGRADKVFEITSDHGGYFQLKTCYPTDYIKSNNLLIEVQKEGYFDPRIINNDDTVFLSSNLNYTIAQYEKAQLSIRLLNVTKSNTSIFLNAKPVGLLMGSEDISDTTILWEIGNKQQFRITFYGEDVPVNDTIYYEIKDEKAMSIEITY